MEQKPKRSSALGRGFEALISDDFDKSLLLDASDRVEKIPIKQIEPNPHQPRKHFDDNSLNELAASIKNHGIIQPLIVKPLNAGKYTLIAGERRWRAAIKSGLKTVPAIIRSSQELDQLELALIENVQRVDLSPLEQALSIERLHEQFSLPFEAIAKKLGKATSTVNNIVRLLQLPAEAKEALAAQQISEGHARAILALKNDPSRQGYLLKAITEQGWNVRQAERFVISVKAGFNKSRQAHARSLTETPLTKRLSQKLGTTVQIRRTAKGGKLEINFKSDEELDRLFEFFS